VGLRVTVLLCALLCGCSGMLSGEPAPPAALFKDASFNAPGERYRAEDLFTVSEPMRAFLRTHIVHQWRGIGQAEALVNALYRKDELNLEYDSARTRNAAEAFQARSGNCLSLVIMTAAFAKELDLEIQYHVATSKETWSRNGNLLLGSGHVNLTIGYGRVNGVSPTRQYGASSMLVDFLPADEIAGLPLREIPESTVVAMYMNNRAVESLVGGNLDDAYGWAREAIRRSPGFGNSYSTLGVIYSRRGDLPQAQRVLRYELQREPDDTVAMSNLADLLSRLGDEAQAAELRHRLTQLDPYPPYYYFDLGMEAMRRNDFQTAKSMFAKEVYRADYNDEFHHWLGVAYFKLGDLHQAERQLLLALERAQNRRNHDLYAAKLAWLEAAERRPHDGPVTAVPVPVQ
jgi:tetratricopeptide (TPR) repeat protein